MQCLKNWVINIATKQCTEDGYRASGRDVFKANVRIAILEETVDIESTEYCRGTCLEKLLLFTPVPESEFTLQKTQELYEYHIFHPLILILFCSSFSYLYSLSFFWQFFFLSPDYSFSKLSIFTINKNLLYKYISSSGYPLW